jgi:hypothetical protein
METRFCPNLDSIKPVYWLAGWLAVVVVLWCCCAVTAELLNWPADERTM